MASSNDARPICAFRSPCRGRTEREGRHHSPSFRAARWLLRFFEEQPDVTIEEAALAAASLVALTGAPMRRPCGPWPKERLAGDGHGA